MISKPELSSFYHLTGNAKRSLKMDPQIVAHYCKKLEKQGFIIWTKLRQNSERKVFTRPAYLNKFHGVLYRFYDDLLYLDKRAHKKLFHNDEPHQILENVSHLINYKGGPIEDLTPQEEETKEIPEEPIEDCTKSKR